MPVQGVAANSTVSGGVLGGGYAADRQRKPELAFRYKVRARVVAEAGAARLQSEGPLRLLSFGPAEGLTLLELDRLLDLEEAVGVEYSEELLERAVPMPSHIRMIRGDVTALPASLGEDSFDLVCALALLEHLPDPVRAVREAVRVLRPGGLFVATCPNPFWDAAAQKLGLLRGIHHEADMDKRRLLGVVRAAGLEPAAFRRFMWAPVAVLPYLRVPVPPALSLRIDRAVESVKAFNWTFVNQCVVGQKRL